MRYISYRKNDSREEKYGFEWKDSVVDIQRLLKLTSDVDYIPHSMLEFIERHKQLVPLIDDRLESEGVLEKCSDLLNSITILAPILNPKRDVICLGLNYAEHIEQNSKATGLLFQFPKVPMFFGKPVTSIIGDNEHICLDRRLTNQLDFEIELGIVIGSKGKNIPKENAWDHIFGYTIVNDISARDVQMRVSQFYQGKGMDTFCPIGPAIVDKHELMDPHALNMILKVNGEIRQSTSTNLMLFKVPEIIAAISAGMTLHPGDMITTATPGGCAYAENPPRFLHDGDIIECEIQPIGILRNTVKEIEGRYEI